MGQFFKQTLASLLGTLMGILIFLGIGVGSLVFLFIVLASQDNRPSIENKSYLVIDLSTPITDGSQPKTFQQVLADSDNPSLSLRQVLQAIETASKDDRIVGIFLDGRKSGGGRGYGTAFEVRNALKQFRAQGKPILAYDTELSEADYFLTSVANEIVVNPMGTLEMNGLASQQTFFTGALEKYGIGVQVVRVGNFKAAVEPFIRKDLSPENQAQLQALLGDVWQTYLTTVGDGRSLSPQQLQAIANDQGLLSAPSALQGKLIDRIAYFDEIIAELKEKTDNKDQKTFRQIALARYVDTLEPKRAAQAKIALIYAEGTIVEGKGTIGQVGGDGFSLEMRKIRQDKDIKAVILRINSPGGSATASDVILREVQLTQAQKPVIVSMGDVAASGGYWIATGGDRIFANPNTLTGSIGVFGLLFNLKDIAQNNGITFDTVKTGELASLTTTSRPKTPQELAIYQKMVNQIYDLFIDKVATARNLPRAKVAEIAQGRVWSGEDAKQLGLVDEIGGLVAALNYGIKTAKLEDKPWSLEEYPKTKTLESLLLGRFVNSGVRLAIATDSSSLSPDLLRWKQQWQSLQELNDPKGVYTRLILNWNFD